MSATSAVVGAEGAAQTASTTQNGTAAPAAQPAPWYGDLSADPDIKGYAELKQWKTPAEALKAARDAERMIGVPKDELIRLPKDAKPEDLNQVYDRLGRPKSPDEYKFESPAGADPEFEKAMRAVIHAEGLNQKQATSLQTAMNAYGAKQAAAAEQALQAKIAAEDEQLHREWPGDTYPQRAEMARRAFQQFSADIFDAKSTDEDREAVFKQFDQILGPAKTLKIFAKIGEQLGGGNGARFVGDRPSGSNFAMTPAAAKERIAELETDKEFGKRYLDGDKAAAKQMDDLIRIVNSGG